MRLPTLTCAVFVVASAVSWADQKTAQTPPIEIQEHSKNAMKPADEIQPHQQIAPNPSSPTVTQSRAEPEQSVGNAETKQRGDESSEFWMIFGRRLKITDTLLVGVTLLLFMATFLLWLHTRWLVIGAEKTAKRQLRAYVGIDSIAFECPSEKNIENYKPVDVALQPPVYTDYVAFVVRNFGETPATNVCVRAAMAEVPGRVMSGIPPDFNPDALLSQTHQTAKEIIPRAHLNRGQTAIFKEVVGDVRRLVRARNRDSTIFQIGRIYYRDIYDRPWSTIFCYQWEPWHAMGERFYPYERFNGEDQTPYPESLEYVPTPQFPGAP